MVDLNSRSEQISHSYLCDEESVLLLHRGRAAGEANRNELCTTVGKAKSSWFSIGDFSIAAPSCRLLTGYPGSPDATVKAQ